MTSTSDPISRTSAVPELVGEEIVMVVCKSSDCRERIHELGVLQVVAQDFVFNVDFSRVAVEGKLAVGKSSVPFIERSQQTELDLIIERQMIEHACRNMHNCALPSESDKNLELRTAVVDSELVVARGVIVDLMRLESEPQMIESRSNRARIHHAQV